MLQIPSVYDGTTRQSKRMIQTNAVVSRFRELIYIKYYCCYYKPTIFKNVPFSSHHHCFVTHESGLIGPYMCGNFSSPSCSLAFISYRCRTLHLDQSSLVSISRQRRYHRILIEMIQHVNQQFGIVCGMNKSVCFNGKDVKQKRYLFTTDTVFDRGRTCFVCRRIILFSSLLAFDQCVF